VARARQNPAAAVEQAALSPTLAPPPVGDRQPAWWGSHLAELRWQGELARLTADPVYWGRDVPRGRGAGVMLIPGFLAGDASLSIMRSWLRRIGYRAYASQIAFNVACSDRALDRLERRLDDVVQRAGDRVALIGHSRGGHFAKALAHRRPDAVCAVISLGAGLDDPFAISVPTRMAIGALRVIYAQTTDRGAGNGCLTDTCRCRFASDFSAPFPLEVPLTSLYSKGDGVVRWRACVVPYARCVEVSGSHVGLAVNRRVYGVVAQTLADQLPAASRLVGSQDAHRRG
jgi:triacylglycerol lipase